MVLEAFFDGLRVMVREGVMSGGSVTEGSGGVISSVRPVTGIGIFLFLENSGISISVFFTKKLTRMIPASRKDDINVQSIHFRNLVFSVTVEVVCCGIWELFKNTGQVLQFGVRQYVRCCSTETLNGFFTR